MTEHLPKRLLDGAHYAALQGDTDLAVDMCRDLIAQHPNTEESNEALRYLVSRDITSFTNSNPESVAFDAYRQQKSAILKKIAAAQNIEKQATTTSPILQSDSPVSSPSETSVDNKKKKSDYGVQEFARELTSEIESGSGVFQNFGGIFGIISGIFGAIMVSKGILPTPQERGSFSYNMVFGSYMCLFFFIGFAVGLAFEYLIRLMSRK